MKIAALCDNIIACFPISRRCSLISADSSFHSQYFLSYFFPPLLLLFCYSFFSFLYFFILSFEHNFFFCVCFFIVRVFTLLHRPSEVFCREKKETFSINPLIDDKESTSLLFILLFILFSCFSGFLRFGRSSF